MDSVNYMISSWCAKMWLILSPDGKKNKKRKSNLDIYSMSTFVGARSKLVVSQCVLRAVILTPFTFIYLIG